MTDTPPAAGSATATSDDVATAVLAAIDRLAAVVDDSGTIVTVTDGLAATVDEEADALVGQPVSALFVEEDIAPEPPATVDRRLVTGGDDGEHSTPVAVRSRRLPATGEGDSLVGLFISDTDDPDERTSLETVGDRFRQLFESVNDAIFVIDTEANRITECNARACELLGYSREELLSMDPREIHPHDFEAFTEFVREVTETGEAWTDELACYTQDDEVVPAEISGTVVTLDGREQLLASVRDISTRVEQEVMLGRQSAAMQAATDGIAIYGDDGRIVYANAAYATLFGYESADAITDETWTDIHDESDRFGLDIEPALSTDGEWRGELTATGSRAEPLPVEASFTRLESGEVLCVAHDISDQQAHEQRLTGLATASRELLAAEDHDAVAEVAIETVETVLDFELAGLWAYDSEANELRRTTVTAGAADLLSEAVAYDLNRSRAGEAYRHETTVRNEPSDDAYAGGSRADLHVPLGEYGVLTVLDSGGSFAEQTVQLVELFAESARAAFMQADREQQLRERQAELERQTGELTVLTEFNSLVSDLIRSLLTAPRGDIQESVCDRLADSPLYEGAWIATIDESGDDGLTPDVVGDERPPEVAADDSVADDQPAHGAADVTVSAATVDTAVVPESSAEAVAMSPFGIGLLADAREAGEYVMTRRELTRRDDPEAGAATDDETFAGAVPISAGPRRFGVLAVIGTDQRGFGEPVGEGLRLLGDALGFAFSAELARSTLIADDAVELEFALGGPFATLSARLDCRCCYRGSMAEDADSQTYRIEFVDTDVDSVEAALTDLSAIREYRLLRETADSCLFALTVDDPSPALLAEAGVNLRSLVAEDGEVRLVVEAPEETDIDSLQSALAEKYDRAEFVSKQHGRRDRLAEGYSQLLGEELTDRQLTVIERAEEMGYFAWPREATAEAVAEALDISSATFHQHLRAAENKLISTFLAEQS